MRNKIYVIVTYSTDPNNKSRYVDSYSYDFKTALLYSSTYTCPCEIVTMEADNERELKDILLRDYNISLPDKYLELSVHETDDKDNQIIMSDEGLLELIAELDVYYNSVKRGMESILAVSSILGYVKDGDKFRESIKLLNREYVPSVVRWLFDGSGELEDSPIDIIQAIILDKLTYTVSDIMEGKVNGNNTDKETI